MNWIRLGNKTINLDLVISFHEEYDDEGLRLELFCVGDEDEPSYEFTGDEAFAFKKFMDSSGSVKVILASPETTQDDPEWGVH